MHQGVLAACPGELCPVELESVMSLIEVKRLGLPFE